MKTRLTILSAIICMLAGFVGPVVADGKVIVPIEDQVFIMRDFDRLYIEAPLAPDLAVMNVRVFGPDNQLLLSKRTMGESIEFLVNGLPDGEYRYETVSIFGNVDLSSRENFVDSETTMARKFGDFKVSNGQIIREDAADDVNDASLLDTLIEKAVYLAGITLDIIVPSAHAADLNADDASPSVYFDDTDTASGIDWKIEGSAAANDLSGSMTVESWINGNSQSVFTINSDGTTNNASSIVVDPDGDLHWAGSTLNFDRGLSNLSIGTSTTGAEIVMSATDPEMRFIDETFSEQFYTNYDTTWFNIGYRGSYATDGDKVKISYAAPLNSMVIAGSGNVGLGTSSPSAPLHVTRNNKTAQLKVSDTSGTIGNLNLLQLDNTGGAQVGFNDTTRPYQWNFIGGRDFKINATTFAGTEFVVTTAGNLTILGVLSENSDVNAKEKIVPVDRQDVLSKIASLPIAEWSYTDTPGERHIGPMAQDFHAAFGLGHDDTQISTLDTAGVALAGIQALLEEYDLLKKENTALLDTLESQAVRLEQVEAQQIMLQSVIAELYEDKAARTLTSNTISN